MQMMSSTLKDTRDEHAIQSAFMAWWAQQTYPGLLFAVPNGGSRSGRAGAMLKAEGVLRGVPDLFYAYPCHDRHGLFIEFKRAHPKGYLSAEQKDVIPRLEADGYQVAVVYSGHGAKKAIEHYLKGAHFGPALEDLGQWENKTK